MSRDEAPGLSGKVAEGSAGGQRTEVDEPSLLQSGGRPWFLDWRVWFGVGITAVSLWYVGRGIPLGDVLTAMKSANLPLLFVLSVPAYVASVWVRALRWRHFTNPIADIPRGALFRAQAIGFLVNNVVPLRIGEFVRSWALARETGTSATAVLGTVVIERTLDVASVLLLAAASLTWAGRSVGGGSGLLAQGALLLLPVGCIPVVGLVILRLWPGQIIAIARWLARPLPSRVADTLERLLTSFSEGLGSLSGGSHLFWIVFHTLVIWLLLSTIPVIAGIVAFGIDLGPPVEMLVTSWILLAAVGVAVAIPSAPGFFGTYQLAFNAVLERFGVEPATALAVGLVVWFVFWITLVALGLLVLRTSHTSLGELTHQSGKDPAAERR